jgi:hypothetical protein
MLVENLLPKGFSTIVRCSRLVNRSTSKDFVRTGEQYAQHFQRKSKKGEVLTPLHLRMLWSSSDAVVCLRSVSRKQYGLSVCCVASHLSNRPQCKHAFLKTRVVANVRRTLRTSHQRVTRQPRLLAPPHVVRQPKIYLCHRPAATEQASISKSLWQFSVASTDTAGPSLSVTSDSLTAVPCTSRDSGEAAFGGKHLT